MRVSEWSKVCKGIVQRNVWELYTGIVGDIAINVIYKKNSNQYKKMRVNLISNRCYSEL